MTKRVLTGIRPTGNLHLGHYVGALELWKKVQDEKQYDCYFLIADVQALTTHAHNPKLLEKSVGEVVTDWLAVGLNPRLSSVHFVLQSQITERYELSVLLSMIAGYNEVMRNPTLKSEAENLKETTLGFINYPVDQAADILMVSPTPPQKGDELLVPVGEDQVPHLEYTRVLAERFNRDYCTKMGKEAVFVPCQALVGRVGRLVGIDGQAKMSKSLGNAIFLKDDEETVKEKVMRMFTDPKRVSPDIPGETINNPVFIYHRAFNPNKKEVEELTKLYQEGKVGDVEVKNKLILAINGFLEPIRERRQKVKANLIKDILKKGTNEASILCKEIVGRIRERMSLRFPD